MTLEKLIYHVVYSPKKVSHSPEIIRKIVVLTLFCLMAFCLLLTFFFESLIISNHPHSYILLVTAIIILIIFIYFRISGNFFLYSIAINIILGIFCVYLVASGGRDKISSIWCLVLPISSFYLLGYKNGIIANSILFILFSIILFLPQTPYFNISYSNGFGMRLILAYLFISSISLALEYSRNKAEQERDELINGLQDALSKVKTLSGLLPICSNCKKIRNDEGYWEEVESFIKDHSSAKFTHGLCQDCNEKLYGNEIWFQDKKDKK